MCGITGIVTWKDPLAASRLERMTARLAHRGPDDTGSFNGDGVYLGHRRLTVIDLSPNGHQPMSNEDGSVWITYNGELYDTSTLRDRLETKGHLFRSETDTEVLIHLYEEEGTDLFSYINGMFSYAIYDCRQKKILLARDRLGIKPLFYLFQNGEFLFASELKAIFEGVGQTPSLRPDAMGQYILQGYSSTPDTLFDGVFAIPPGHYLEIGLNQLREGRIPEPVEYWDAPFTGNDDRPLHEIETELEALLSDAVKIRMVADVPLGAFLSGGIDSSSVVALMARLNHNPVRTFTVDVPGTDRSEREKARAVAERYHTAHTEIDSIAAGADDYWPRLAHFDAPFNCASLLNAWLVSREARRYVTVALSGDGGDELFGGYARYLYLGGKSTNPWFSRILKSIKSLLPYDLRGRARIDQLSKDDFEKAFTARHPMPIEVAEKLVGTSLQPWVERMRTIYERYSADPLTRAMYLDAKTYLADHILAKVDSASMAVSLEVRVPILDHRVVEFAGRIPSSLKVNKNIGKWLLKKLAAKWLPDGLVDQKKIGFDPPLADWVFGDETDHCLKELISPEARCRQYLDGHMINRWIRHLQKPNGWHVPQRATLWAIYQFNRWLQMSISS